MSPGTGAEGGQREREARGKKRIPERPMGPSIVLSLILNSAETPLTNIGQPTETSAGLQRLGHHDVRPLAGSPRNVGTIAGTTGGDGWGRPGERGERGRKKKKSMTLRRPWRGQLAGSYRHERGLDPRRGLALLRALRRPRYERLGHVRRGLLAVFLPPSGMVDSSVHREKRGITRRHGVFETG